MNYKIELKIPGINGLDEYNRMPGLNDIKIALDKYSYGQKGIIILHDTMYAYKYDTQANTNYHNVDSRQVIGRVYDTIIDQDKIYIHVDVKTDMIDLNEQYICFFRAQMESETLLNKQLKITNLFAIDLVHVLEQEKTEKMEFSTIENLD